MGLSKKYIKNIIYLIEGVVTVASAIGTMLVYKYILMQKIVGEFIPNNIFIIYLLAIVLIGLGVIYFYIRLMNKKIEDSNLIQVLYTRGDVE